LGGKKSLQRKERAGQWQTIRQKTSWIFEESVVKSVFFPFAKKGSLFQNQVQLWLGLKKYIFYSFWGVSC
jgi:hypothetical protein